jgi:hypothetical protein
MKGINKIELKIETVNLPTNMNMDYLRSAVITYLLTPWSRVLLEELTSKLCS